MVFWDKIINMERDTSINRVDRSKVRIVLDSNDSSDFVDLPCAECVAFVWELTRELWSLTGDTGAEQRLQRNVAVIKSR